MAETKVTKREIDPLYRQSGWGFVNITVAGTEQFADVTFPTAFAAPPIIVTTPLGWTTGTVTDPSSFTGGYAASFGLSHHIINVTATGFRILLRGGQAFGVSKSGFSWIAEAQ